MIRNPYKFLDFYTKEDKEIFFGRDKEIEEIYSKIFQSRILTLYGPSGVGKTSILQCGIANKISLTDWNPIFIRRNDNILNSVKQTVERYARRPVKEDAGLVKRIHSLYLDYLTPVYLIFDQLEELFVFGGMKEKEEFMDFISTISNYSESNIRILFIIREEYLADLTYLESKIPNFFENRYRIERMSRMQIIEPILGPARMAGIKSDEGLAKSISEKLVDEKGNVELTYLQVLMDRLFKKALERDQDNLYFSKKDVNSFGKLGNLLGDYLDNQINNFEQRELGESILKTMVSLEGTKRPMQFKDIDNQLKQLNKDINKEEVLKIIQYFINARILKDRDENDFYELRHDSLASRIFERMTLVEKELLEIQQYVQNVYQNYKRRKVLLRKEDLDYIKPYVNRIHLNKPEREFINLSKKLIEKSRRRKRNLLASLVIVLLFLFASFTTWALFERGEAEDQKKSALQALKQAKKAENKAFNQQQIADEQRLIAEKEKENAENAYNLAVNKVYDNMLGSLAISANNMNVFYLGIWNPISISVSGLPTQNIQPYIISGNAELQGGNGNYQVFPKTRENVIVGVKGSLDGTNILNFSRKSFRVINLSVPIATIAGLSEGEVSIDELIDDPYVRCSSQEEQYFSGLDFKINGYTIGVIINGDWIQRSFTTPRIDSTFLETLKGFLEQGVGIKMFVENIEVEMNLDNTRRTIAPLSLKLINSDFNVEKQQKEEIINKLLFAAGEEKEPYKAYRFVEAAYLLDTNRLDNRRKLLQYYISSFSNLRRRYGFDDNCKIFISDNSNRIVKFDWNSKSKRIIARIYRTNEGTAIFVDSIHYEGVSQTMYEFSKGIITEDRIFVIKPVNLNQKKQNSLLTYSLLIYNNSGGFIKNSIIKQRSLTHSVSNSGELLVSLPLHMSTFNLGKNDTRASLWNKNGEFITYLWGKKKVNMNRPKNIKYDGIDYPVFIFNDSLILACNRYHNYLSIFNRMGDEIAKIATEFSPEYAFITPKKDIIYSEVRQAPEHQRRIILNSYLVDSSNSIILYDSLSHGDFAFSNCGKYYIIITNKYNKNGLDEGVLFDYNRKIITTYPITRINGIIRVNRLDNKLYLTNNDSRGANYRFSILPINDIYNSIINYVNQDKLFGNVTELTLDDLQQYGIPNEVLWRVQHIYKPR